MRILVIVREESPAALIKAKLEPLAHKVFHQPDKTAAIEQLTSNEFDVILLDPSPMEAARPMLLNIRRSVKNYPYIVILSDTLSQEGALKIGANDVLTKAVDSEALLAAIKNAGRLLTYLKRVSDDSIDFPSAGGVIAKSAFKQLFLSALDRADRYGEHAYVLSIQLSNYREILDLDGVYAADYAVAKLSQYLVLLRRQSDIIGQTEKNEYSLLLQSAGSEHDPVQAATRFAEALAGYDDIMSSGAVTVDLKVTLLELPIGRKRAEHHIQPPAGRE